MKLFYILLFLQLATVSTSAQYKKGGTFNPLPDTLAVHTKTTTLLAGNGYVSYIWNTGDTSATTSVNQTGWYFVTVNDAQNNVYTDSCFVNFLWAKIQPRDTTILQGTGVQLSLDTTDARTGSILYVPGAYQNWDPSNANTCAKLISKYNTSFYEGYVYVPTAVSYEFKFTSGPGWNYVNYGAGATAGTLNTSNNAANLRWPAGAGYYHVTVNLATNTFTANAVNWGIVGDAALGWSVDIPLLYDTGKKVWSNTVNLNQGLIKFRANNSWNLNYGAVNTSNELVWYGENLRVPTAGLYTVELKLNDANKYTYKLMHNNYPLLLNPTIMWSTGDSTKTIQVYPNQTTLYRVTVSNGLQQVMDSTQVFLTTATTFNPLPDTISVLNKDFIVLDAGQGYNTYSWNNGSGFQTSMYTQSGKAKVQVTVGPYTFEDSTFISFLKLKAYPTQDTSINQGDSVWITVVTLAKRKAPQLWVVGNFQGSNPATASTITQGNTSNIYVYDGFVYVPTSGVNTFKLFDAPNSSANIYGSLATDSMVKNGGVDMRFDSGAGLYYLQANLYTNKWKAIKTTWSVIGSAAQGWNTDVPMLYDTTTGLWTVTTTLSDGFFKFRANNNWNLNYGGLNYDSNLVWFGTDIKVITPGTYKISLQLNQSKQFTYKMVLLSNPTLTAPRLIWTDGSMALGRWVKPTTSTSYVVQVNNGISVLYDTVNVWVNASLTGTVRNINGHVVNDVQVEAINTNTKKISMAQVQPNTGLFTHDLITGENYVLKAIKTKEGNRTNGVNVIDIALVQMHILNKTTFNNAFQKIAADVNGDGKINVLDMVFMKRFILGIDTTFRGNKLWVFVDSSYTNASIVNPFPIKDSLLYNPLLSTQSNQSLIAIKLGDVNFNWNPNAQRLLPVSTINLSLHKAFKDALHFEEE